MNQREDIYMGMTDCKDHVCFTEPTCIPAAGAITGQRCAGDVANERTADAGQTAVACAISDGAGRFPEEYDLAVAYSWRVVLHTMWQTTSGRKKRRRIIHIDYHEGGIQQGTLDRDCYLQYDAVFPIGEQVKRAVSRRVSGMCSARTRIYHNRIDCRKNPDRCPSQPGGFTDDFDGIRLLTVGRLTPQKAYPVAIEAMRQLKAEGYPCPVVCAGRGKQPQETQSSTLRRCGLKEDFLLLGAVTKSLSVLPAVRISMCMRPDMRGKALRYRRRRRLDCAIIASEM